MREAIKAAIKWAVGALTDPVTKDGSSARIGALLLCIVGCAVALKFPSEAATVAALVGGGCVAIWTRTKSG